jgi:hypothetical protein
VVEPFSGLIRRSLLRSVKRNALTPSPTGRGAG